MEDLTIRGSKSVKNIDNDAINADIEILENQEEPILSLIKNDFAGLNFIYNFTCLSMPINQTFITRLFAYHKGGYLLTKGKFFFKIWNLNFQKFPNKN